MYKNVEIEVHQYNSGWQILGVKIVTPKVTQLFNTDSTMALLVDMRKDKYIEFLHNNGAILEPFNDVTYFKNKLVAEALIPIVYSKINFAFGDHINNMSL